MSERTSKGGPATFRDIPGFPGYRACSDGTIWSCRRIHNPGGRVGAFLLTDEWHELTSSVLPQNSRRMYHIMQNGKSRSRYAYHLVLEAFVGPCPDGMEACHSDGNQANDHLGNLRWDTHAGNMADKIRHGTDNRGEKHNMAKLTRADVAEIRRLLGCRVKQRSIASQFGVTNATINDIAKGRTWSHGE